MQTTTEQTQALAHVLWLGGTPCSGKTSVARWLVEHYDVQLYHYDKHERRHVADCLSEQQPEMSAYAAMDMDMRWVHRPVAEMVRATEAAWRERFSMVIDDLRALPQTTPILAEGPGLLPLAVAPYLHHSRQAVWLVPTEGFKRATQPTRGGAPANQTSNPDQAYCNLIDLDLQLAMNVKRRAAEHPGRFRDLQLCTLQRRVQQWRATALLTFQDTWLAEDRLAAVASDAAD